MTYYRLDPDDRTVTKPDWRDPNMPVIAKVELTDGTRTWFEWREVSPSLIRQNSRKRMYNLSPQLDWRNDPTYNLRRKKP